jgi:hypothetical protein
MEKKTLEIGDKIRVRNIFNNFVVEIERLTKTQAITKPYNSAGATYKFKLELVGGDPKPVGMGKWNTTEYSLIK